ncbi:MAG: hypothetical protein Q9205_006530, partial [Flavoplaca limonia]
MASDKPLPFAYQFAAGAVAGVSEGIVLNIADSCDVNDDSPDVLSRPSADDALRYPLDVVKTRVQLQQGKGIGEEGYNGMMDCFRKIIKNEGASRLYRGITAPILMEAPK